MKISGISIIGMGKMGEAVAQGLRKKAGAPELMIRGTTRSAKSAEDVRARLDITCDTDNAAAVAASNIVLFFA